MPIGLFTRLTRNFVKNAVNPGIADGRDLFNILTAMTYDAGAGTLVLAGQAADGTDVSETIKTSSGEEPLSSTVNLNTFLNPNGGNRDGLRVYGGFTGIGFPAAAVSRISPSGRFRIHSRTYRGVDGSYNGGAFQLLLDFRTNKNLVRFQESSDLSFPEEITADWETLYTPDTRIEDFIDNIGSTVNLNRFVPDIGYEQTAQFRQGFRPFDNFMGWACHRVRPVLFVCLSVQRRERMETRPKTYRFTKV